MIPGDRRLCNYNDATDSAAATFFRVLAAYIASGGSPDVLKRSGRKQQVERIATTLLDLQQPDGLMWAKRDYRAKFLEDNCEVYDGLRALAVLEKTVYKDEGGQSKFSLAADRVRRGIVKELYDANSKHWIVAKDESGKRTLADLNRWYPDMQSQMWPLLWGVVSSSDERARSITNALNAIWNGASPSHQSWAKDPQAVNGGWINADAAYAAQLGGDEVQIAVYLKAVKQLKYPASATAPQFPWPFTIADAGWLLRILAKTEK